MGYHVVTSDVMMTSGLRHADVADSDDVARSKDRGRYLSGNLGRYLVPGIWEIFQGDVAKRDCAAL